MSRLGGFLPDLRPGEKNLALLMSASYFLLLLFYYLLKPARDSLFLVEISPAQLPLVYVLSALVAAPVTAIYARAGLKYRLDRLIARTIFFLMVNLVILRWLIGVQQGWVFYLFYIWVGVAGGLITSQFWLLANGMFDAAQAKRLFPLLGLGGIAGAFCGGEITGFLIRNLHLATEDLLLVSILVLAMAGLASRLAWKINPAQPDTPGDIAGDEAGKADFPSIIRSIGRSRHLTLTVGIISLTVMTTSFVDFQFKTVTWQAIGDTSELTTFLGRFYGRMSLLSFLLQAVFAARLIRWLGVGGVLLVLPAVLTGGALGMVLAPGLPAAMFLRGGDMALKYSVDKTSRELLFLPIPLALKKRTKVFIDLFADRWARGMAGGLLLLFTLVWHWDLTRIAMATLVLLAVWMVLALMMRREYLETFRQVLQRREFDLAGMTVQLDDPAALKILVGALGSRQPREVIYALDMLRDVRSATILESVRPLVDHTSPEVRRRALEVLGLSGDESDAARAIPLLADPDLGVRVAAIACVIHGRGDEATDRAFLAEILADEPGRRNAAVAFIATAAEAEPFRDLVSGQVAEAILNDSASSGNEGRMVLAGLPWDPTPSSEDLWNSLADDPDTNVLEAVIAGFGARHDFGRVAWLLRLLDHPHLRSHTRGALAELARADAGLIDDLGVYFHSEEHPARAREEIPRILELVPAQRSVDILLEDLVGGEPVMRFGVLKALGKLRSRYPALEFGENIVSAEIALEAGRYFHLARLGALLPEKSERDLLLNRVVAETRRLRLESVFRLLGLMYPLNDVLNAYHGVMSGRRIPRANAQEFLDNLLDGRHRKLVLSLIDEQPALEAWRESGLLADLDVGEPARNTGEALAILSGDIDPWLAACARYAGGGLEYPVTDHFLEKTGVDMLSPIEKVLLLQNVEVFSEVPTDQLAALANIAREVSVLKGDTVFLEHDTPDALYLVLEGHVRLHQGERDLTTADPLMPFGTWALFDDEPRVMTATANEDSRLLRIDRNDFNDLLSDDVRIAKGIIRTVTRKLRDLAGRAV